MSDMYSFGMLVFELLRPSLTYPWQSTFGNKRPELIYVLISRAVENGERPEIPVYDELGYHGAADIMKNCWSQSPQSRPTAEKVMENIIKLVNLEVSKRLSNCTIIDAHNFHTHRKNGWRKLNLK